MSLESKLINNYLYNQCISPLKLLVRISLRQVVFDTTLCNKVCQWLAAGLLFSPGIPISSTNKTVNHDITEILLKVMLNTINHNQSTIKFDIYPEVNKAYWGIQSLIDLLLINAQWAVFQLYSGSSMIYRVLYDIQFNGDHFKFLHNLGRETWTLNLWVILSSVLSVLPPITTSDCPFGIFKLFMEGKIRNIFTYAKTCLSLPAILDF